MAPILRVRTRFTAGTVGPGLATHHFAVLSGSAADAQVAVDRVRDFWAALKACMSSTATWAVDGSVDQLDVDTGNLQTFYNVTGRSDGGSGSGDPLPPANQVLVKWSTPGVVAGHRVQGRTFCPRPLESNTDTAGSPSGPWIAAVPAAATAIIGSGSVQFVIYSRPAPGATPPRTGSIHLVTGGTLWPKMAVLRSRRD